MTATEKLAGMDYCQFVEANTLWNQFNENEVAADSKFTGRDIFVVGAVLSLEKRGGGVTIILVASRSYPGVECRLTSNSAKSDDLSRIQAGSWVRVSGYCNGFSSIKRVQVTGCEFALVNQ